MNQAVPRGQSEPVTVQMRHNANSHVSSRNSLQEKPKDGKSGWAPISKARQSAPVNPGYRASRDMTKVLRASEDGSRFANGEETEPSIWKDVDKLASKFNGKRVMTPPGVKSKLQTKTSSNRSYKVFDANAIKAPGVMYKTVICDLETSCDDFIRQVLDRFGSSANVDEFELHYAVEVDGNTKKKKTEPPKILHKEDCPALVADWFTDKPRRFEIHAKTSQEKAEKLNRKWSEYWSSPSIVRKSIRRTKKK